MTSTVTVDSIFNLDFLRTSTVKLLEIKYNTHNEHDE